MLRASGCAAAILTALLFSSNRASAANPDSDAAAAFEEGARAFAAGDFARAAEAFDLAYASRPHHDALWNAARAHQRAGDDVRAANLYARYLREAPADARDRDLATASLQALGATLGRVDIHAAADITRVQVDGHAIDSREVWVSPGDHLIEGTAPSGPVRSRARANPGQRVSVTLEVALVRPDDRDRGRAFPWPILAAGGGLTLLLGGVTVWSALDTVEQKKTFDSERSPSNLDEGRARQTRTNVLLGVTAGVAAVTGAAIAIVMFAPRDRAASASSARLHIDARGAWVTGTF